MLGLKLNRIIFASEATDLFGAVNRPKAWPSFAYQVSELNLVLHKMKDWKLESETACTNIGANLIAQSASFGNRCHSYVARGYPFWLTDIFDKDKASAHSGIT